MSATSGARDARMRKTASRPGRPARFPPRAALLAIPILSPAMSSRELSPPRTEAAQPTPVRRDEWVYSVQATPTPGQVHGLHLKPSGETSTRWEEAAEQRWSV